MPKLTTVPPATAVAPLSPLARRITALGRLLGMVGQVPSGWLTGQNKGLTGQTAQLNKYASGDLAPTECLEYKHLILGWRKALKWTQGLDDSLSVMLAAVISTRSVGDQLWVKVMGPASCGKSTLCEAVSVAKKYVTAKSTIRGFVSGYDTGDGKDCSLAPQLNGKTLVTKDGDTLLQSPNLGQILSEARDLYDSTTRTHYRNAKSNDYAGIRMTWILCGTASLRALDASELGARFLDCIVMQEIDSEMEDEVLRRVAYRTERNMGVEADGSAETNYEPELAQVMMITGGYVNYLREHADKLLKRIKTSDNVLHRCTRLGKFVAFMRARPSKMQKEHSEREFAARLVSQHVRLAKCLAAVLNVEEVNEEVMRRVRKVSFDTSHGQTLDVVTELQKCQAEGLESRALCILINRTEEETRKLLRFLRHIKVVETDVDNHKRWRLTDSMFKLYKEVVS